MNSLHQVSEQAGRAAEIIRRLRRFVTKAKPVQTPVDINAILRERGRADEHRRPDGPSRGVLRVNRAAPPVMGDRIQIEQVIVNLMRNAFEAMRDSEPASRLLHACAPPSTGRSASWSTVRQRQSASRPT